MFSDRATTQLYSAVYLKFHSKCPLFVPQAIHWIAYSGLYGLKTDSHQGDKDGQNAGSRQNPPGYRNTVWEILEPVIHHPPGYRK
jgi:hypothetical protein